MTRKKMFAGLLEAITRNIDIKSAVKFYGPHFVMKATRIGARPSRFQIETCSEDLRVTMGRPNFREREFIKFCKKAGQPFPVSGIQLKYYPKKKR